LSYRRAKRLYKIKTVAQKSSVPTEQAFFPATSRISPCGIELQAHSKCALAQSLISARCAQNLLYRKVG